MNIKRVNFISALGLIIWAVWFGRLCWLQIFCAPYSKTLAKKQHEQRIGLLSERGKIFDAQMRVLAFNLKGKRIYSYLTSRESGQYLAASILGTVGKDGEGLGGIEWEYDAILRGENGWAIFQKDASGKPHYSPEYPQRIPKAGMDLILTLDIDIQSTAQMVLKETVQKFQAKGGTIIIMKVKTGEILAVANEPLSPLKNQAVEEVFEPGSTFKAFLLAAALEEKVLNSSDSLYGANGQIIIAGDTIREAEGHKYGWLTLSGAIEKSSNICAVEISKRLGPQRIYQYARSFGFGCRTGIDLSGEAEGFLTTPETWSIVKTANISFGQGLSVTPLQLACGFAALANKGILIAPRIIKAVRNGEIVQESSPLPVRKVISEETALKVREILVKVVEQGTGIRAKVEGLQIAGKTGTAQKKAEGQKSYAKGKTVASFAGYFPAEDPLLVIVVIVDEPKSGGSGMLVAAPAFKRVTEMILSQLSQEKIQISNIKNQNLKKMEREEKELNF
ncbi:MAG: penicillin-binding protein 2 [Candidatus Edwardsbacteria bacterium]